MGSLAQLFLLVAASRLDALERQHELGQESVLLQAVSASERQALATTSHVEAGAQALQCGRGSDCVVEQGETRVVTASMDLRTLVVRGTLKWDTSKDGLEL